jgi:DNA mismatch repair protein MSH2
MEDREEIVLAIIVKEATSSWPISCAIAAINKSVRGITICEFNDTALLPTAESILNQIQPRSIVAVCQHTGLANQLVAVAKTVTDSPVELQTGSLSYFDSSLVDADLERLLKHTPGKQFEWTKRSDLARKAFQVLCTSYRLLANASNHKACSFNVSSGEGIFMKLDRATFNALNIFPSNMGSGQLQATASLFGLLNKCKTRMGTRRLQLWLRQPLVDAKTISERHDVVEALVSSARVRQIIQGARLSRVPDLDAIAAKLAQANDAVILEDLVRVYEGIVAVNCLIDDLKSLQSEAVENMLVIPLDQAVRNMEGFMRLVESTLDLEAASHNDFRVDAKFDPQLGSLNEKRIEIKQAMDNLRAKVPADNVRIVECLAPYGMAFRVSRKQMGSVSGGKYKQVQINKGEYLFTNERLMDLVEEFMAVEKEYGRKSLVVVKKIVSVAGSYFAVVAELAELLGKVDVLTSFSVIANMCKLTRANISEAPIDSSLGIGDLELRRCRHLLVELRSLEMFGTDYIPNDVRMDAQNNIQIITGPNMGGKSTYIRSVAMAVLLNQIGCFVPCDPGAKLPVFESIMCRVGASDAQVRGISTFMQEMIEAATIVNSANNRSLVIIDELGRGTSTQDGFGLAWAISKFLKEQAGAFVFFATHFHELSQLPGAVNRHVAAAVSDQKLTLLYEVRDGPTSNSFGPNVAALAGYPQEVVEDAIARERKMVYAANRMETVRE